MLVGGNDVLGGVGQLLRGGRAEAEMTALETGEPSSVSSGLMVRTRVALVRTVVATGMVRVPMDPGMGWDLLLPSVGPTCWWGFDW